MACPKTTEAESGRKTSYSLTLHHAGREESLEPSWNEVIRCVSPGTVPFTMGQNKEVFEYTHAWILALVE